MTPQAFCQLAMIDYERQWTAAAGHQERHPLRVKMERLKELTEQAVDAPALTRLLGEGCASDDPIWMLLCSELQPWWERVRDAGPAVSSEHRVP